MAVEVKEIVQDYILIVYDIPQNSPKMRKVILKRLAEIGGIMHTDSCYLLPYSADAMILANQISTCGDVVVWKSKQEDEHVAKLITMKYEQHLHNRCTVIWQRLEIIADHLKNERLGKAHVMAWKTKKFLDQLKKIAENYHTDWLPKEIEALEKSLSEVYNTT
jgi:hypothetical protein